MNVQALKEKILKIFFKKDRLILMILTGVLLFVIALPVTNKKEDPSGQKEKTSLKGSLDYQTDFITGNNKAGSQQENQTANSAVTVSQNEVNLYKKTLEEELANMLKHMNGVGDTMVMITMESTGELVIEKDENTERKSTNEQDSAGGHREITEMSSKTQSITGKQSGEEGPFVIKTIAPKVSGVLVVAEGAGNGGIKKEIVEVVSALFGIEMHKIKVVKMQIQ